MAQKQRNPSDTALRAIFEAHFLHKGGSATAARVVYGDEISPEEIFLKCHHSRRVCPAPHGLETTAFEINTTGCILRVIRTALLYQPLTSLGHQVGGMSKLNGGFSIGHTYGGSQGCRGRECDVRGQPGLLGQIVCIQTAK